MGILPDHLDRGDKRCSHHRGMIRRKQHQCCGGQVAWRAVIRCTVQGEVEVGKQACDTMCRHHKKK